MIEIFLIYMYISILIGGLMNVSGISPFNLGIPIIAIVGISQVQNITKSAKTRKYAVLIVILLLDMILTSLLSERIQFSLKYLFYYFSFCALMLISLAVKNAGIIRKMLKILLGFQLLFLLVVFVEIFYGFRFVQPTTDLFVSQLIPIGFFGNANGFASTIFITFGLLYYSLISSEYRYTAYMLVFIVCITLYATMSRGCIVAYVLYLICIFFIGKGTIKTVLKTSLILLLTILLIISITGILGIDGLDSDKQAVIDRNITKLYSIENMYDLTIDNSNNIRVDMIKYVVYNFEEFIIGKGPGMSQYIMINSSGFSMNPHNLWLELYMDGGLLGLGIFVTIYFVLIRDLYGIIRSRLLDKSLNGAATASLLTLFIYPIISAINSGNIGFSTMYIPFSFSMMIIAIAEENREKEVRR